MFEDRHRSLSDFVKKFRNREMKYRITPNNIRETLRTTPIFFNNKTPMIDSQMIIQFIQNNYSKPVHHFNITNVKNTDRPNNV